MEHDVAILLLRENLVKKYTERAEDLRRVTNRCRRIFLLVESVQSIAASINETLPIDLDDFIGFVNDCLLELGQLEDIEKMARYLSDILQKVSSCRIKMMQPTAEITAGMARSFDHENMSMIERLSRESLVYSLMENYLLNLCALLSLMMDVIIVRADTEND